MTQRNLKRLDSYDKSRSTGDPRSANRRTLRKTHPTSAAGRTDREEKGGRASSGPLENEPGLLQIFCRQMAGGSKGKGGIKKLVFMKECRWGGMELSREGQSSVI